MNQSEKSEGASRVGSSAGLGINELDKLIEDMEWRVEGDPDNLSREQLHQLLQCARELKMWREGGVTEELLRRHDGYIKVGKGCVVALASMMPNDQAHAPRKEKL